MAYEELGPDAVEWMGVAFRTILTSEATGGAMSIVDSVAPVDFSPPRHVHEREDECFVILSGECEFWLEGETFRRGPGETAFVPRGKEHSFRVVGDAPCRHMVILTPGGFEAFFAAMAANGYTMPDDMEAVNAAAAQHHLAFTGPPLGTH